MPTGHRETPENRESQRFHLKLRMAIVYPEHGGHPVHPIYHATTHDIGVSGLSIIVEDNVFYEGEVTLLLTLPPVHSWAAPKIIEASARMSYAIRSSKLNAFKIGMKLVGFKDDGGMLLHAALQRALERHSSTGRQGTGSRHGSYRKGDTYRMRR